MAGRKDRQKRQLTQLSDIMESRPMGKLISELLCDYKLLKNWEEIIGSSISSQTRPGRIKRGVLHLKVSNSAVLNELYFLKSDLISKVNRELGKGAIKDIKFQISSIRKATCMNVSP